MSVASISHVLDPPLEVLLLPKILPKQHRQLKQPTGHTQITAERLQQALDSAQTANGTDSQGMQQRGGKHRDKSKTGTTNRENGARQQRVAHVTVGIPELFARNVAIIADVRSLLS